MKRRILIADDHDVVRAGLQRIVTEHFTEVAFGEASCSRELLELASNETWDLALVDIKMPGRSGLEMLADLQRVSPKMPVLILTAFAESEYGARALEAGACGFVNKAHVSAELPAAMERILSGGKYVSPQLAEILADYLGGKTSKLAHDALSEREMQVLRLIAKGMETAEIAAELALSEKTIATYRSRIYEKLAVKNNVELTRYAIRHQLVD